MSTDGITDERKEGRTDGKTDGRTNERVDGTDENYIPLRRGIISMYNYLNIPTNKTLRRFRLRLVILMCQYQLASATCFLKDSPLAGFYKETLNIHGISRIVINYIKLAVKFSKLLRTLIKRC